jgi:hypothetical protein
MADRAVAVAMTTFNGLTNCIGQITVTAQMLTTNTSLSVCIYTYVYVDNCVTLVVYDSVSYTTRATCCGQLLYYNVVVILRMLMLRQQYTVYYKKYTHTVSLSKAALKLFVDCSVV